MYKSFFHFQHGILGQLWRWGLASVGVGALLSASKRPWLRQFGLQALTWGGIDAVLAHFGRRDAVAKLADREADEAPAARRFRLILLINAGLDLIYIAVGWRLARGTKENPGRRGLGAGVLVQGLFLLGFDAWTALQTGRWTQD